MTNNALPIDLNFSLTGRVAVVTGGASGIGFAIAQAFSEKGATVAIVDVASDKASRAATELSGPAQGFGCDVTDAGNVTATVKAAIQAFGRINILVNCAGIVHLAPAEELALDAWDRTLAVNLTGTFIMSQAVGNQMLKSGGGKIINMASQAASVALNHHAAYCASKFGVLGMTKVLAAEWGRHGVTANTISPTVVLTELGHKAWDGPKGDALKEQIPVGRFAYPEEIAACAVFLASSASDMINGADLVVDGGYTIQ